MSTSAKWGPIMSSFDLLATFLLRKLNMGFILLELSARGWHTFILTSAEAQISPLFCRSCATSYFSLLNVEASVGPTLKFLKVSFDLGSNGYI